MSKMRGEYQTALTREDSMRVEDLVPARPMARQLEQPVTLTSRGVDEVVVAIGSGKSPMSPMSNHTDSSFDWSQSSLHENSFACSSVAQETKNNSIPVNSRRRGLAGKAKVMRARSRSRSRSPTSNYYPPLQDFEGSKDSLMDQSSFASVGMLTDSQHSSIPINSKRRGLAGKSGANTKLHSSNDSGMTLSIPHPGLQKRRAPRCISGGSYDANSAHSNPFGYRDSKGLSQPPPGSQMTKLAPAMLGGNNASIHQNSRRDKALNFASRSNHTSSDASFTHSIGEKDPGFTTPLEYRTVKGLSKPHPGSQMTRLEPPTSLGSTNHSVKGPPREVYEVAHPESDGRPIEDIENPLTTVKESFCDDEGLSSVLPLPGPEMTRYGLAIGGPLGSVSTHSVPRPTAPGVTMVNPGPRTQAENAYAADQEEMRQLKQLKQAVVASNEPDPADPDPAMDDGMGRFQSLPQPVAPAVMAPGAYRVEVPVTRPVVLAAEPPPPSLPELHPPLHLNVPKGSSPKPKRLLSAGCAIVLVAVVVVAVVVAVKTGGGEGALDAKEDTLSPTMAPTAPTRPPGTDIDDYVWSMLPETTIAAIVGNSTSPQALAIDWLLNDPSVEEYTNTRLLQRLSLATLYYATSGEQWKHGGNWLSYNHHECDWSEDACDEADKVNGEYALDAKIEQVTLARGNLLGSIPPEISLLSNLVVIDFSENKMEGSLPSELGLLTKLAKVYLNENHLTGSLPPQLGALHELTDLLMDRNQMTGALPTNIGNLGNLKRLSLERNYLTGSLPSEIGNLTNIVQFILDYNRLKGALPSELGQMGITSLRKLTLMNNTLTGSIPSTLASLSSLEELALGNNTFASTIPQALPLTLKVLNLGWSGLSGTLPSELGLLTKLHTFYIYKNIDLTGPIPSELGLCTDMQDLQFDFNKLSGTIPTQIGLMTNLRVLSLYLNNFLTGAIPSEVGLCTKLEHLYLDRNKLSGPLPAELGNLKYLRELIISDTALTGTLPASLCGIANLDFECDSVCGCQCPC